MYKTEMLLMRRIHATDVEWRMGCIPGDEGVKRSAAMLRTEASRLVRLTKDYYIGIYELTQRQWTLLGSTETETIANPSRYQDTSLYAGDPLVKPVEKFTYITLRGKSTDAWKGWPECGHDVAEGSFLQKARLKSGILFDAPTDAQWEFACRAGTTTVLNNGKDIKSNYDAAGVGCPEYDEVAWHSKNSFLTNEHGVYTNQTHEVGTKRPNDWGLYDMHGNIFEWCLDWVTDSVSNGSLEVQVDPVGLLRGGSTSRHIRGGSCQHFVNNGRTSSKMLAGEGWGDYVGVRLTAPVGGEW
jgi:formylglycine-generating enzyme required for sulfatase activity